MSRPPQTSLSQNWGLRGKYPWRWRQHAPPKPWHRPNSLKSRKRKQFPVRPTFFSGNLLEGTIMSAVLQQRGTGGNWSCMARNVSSGHRGEPRWTLRSATKQICRPPLPYEGVSRHSHQNNPGCYAGHQQPTAVTGRCEAVICSFYCRLHRDLCSWYSPSTRTQGYFKVHHSSLVSFLPH
jgi:hypothetical protein